MQDLTGHQLSELQRLYWSRSSLCSSGASVADQVEAQVAYVRELVLRGAALIETAEQRVLDRATILHLQAEVLNLTAERDSRASEAHGLLKDLEAYKAGPKYEDMCGELAHAELEAQRSRGLRVELLRRVKCLCIDNFGLGTEIWNRLAELLGPVETAGV